jgi:ribosomal protein S7
MRRVRKFLKKRYKHHICYNFYQQLWFNYHHVFFGSLIFKGKKAKAFNTFLQIKKGLKFKENFDPFLVFLVAMMKITPSLVLLPIRKAGSTHGVPFPINQRKQITFAVRWAIKLLKDNHRIFKVSTIVDLLVSAIYNRGLAIQKKKELYKISMQTRHLIKFFR